MEPYIYLREYTQREKEVFNTLLDTCSKKLPYTLATPMEQICQHIRAKNYGKAMNYALDFFEISTQYLSCLLLIYIQEEQAQSGASGESLHRIINKIDQKRPLSFGDWVNDIFTPLASIAAKEIPNNPLVASIHKYIITKKKNILLGDKREPSIVQIRNEYKGHSTTLSETIYQGVVYTLEPRILLFLEAMLPLTEWFYFTLPENESGKLILLNGTTLQEKMVKEVPPFMKKHHYYISPNPIGDIVPTNVIDVFPLVFCNEQQFVYVFQTLKDEEIAFVSSNEDAITFTSDCWNEALDVCFQKSLSSFDISKDLNWDELKELMKVESGHYLDRIYKEKKYNQELFVDRKRLTDLLHQFISSEQTLFPLLGEAGQGKTNQLCYWTETLIETEKGVIIFNCSGFSEISLEEKLKDIFAFSRRKPLEKLLDALHRKASENNEIIYFFFDAVNECLTYAHSSQQAEGPLELYKDIRRILIKEEYPNFKVLFTCRSYTWKNLLHKYVPSEDNLTFNNGNEEEASVRGFSDEELREAYQIYRQLYQMNTPFEELNRSVIIRLKDPLVLKMACTNYLGAELPGIMLPFTSISLFDRMFQDIDRSYAGHKQCAIIREMAGNMLDKYEQGIPTDSISVDELQRAYENPAAPLHTMARLVYKKDGISVAYAELQNKPERPILRLVESTQAGKDCSIQFIYERFLEYALALVFMEREIQKLSDETANVAAITFVEKLHGGSTNVVFMGILRNALIMDFLRTGNLSTIMRLAGEYGADYEVMLLITETLNVLIRENYEKEAFALIKQLINEHVTNGESLISAFNAINKKIESNEADDKVISEHKQLYAQLAPIIRLRKLASVSTLNGIFLTDYFNEGLYVEDPYQLLWALMTDTINEVQNDACLYTYYLSNKTHTIDYSPLKENLSEKIVKEMYHIIKETPIAKMVGKNSIRRRTVIFLETATRISVLLMIDALLSSKGSDRERVQHLLSEIISIVRYMTGNFYLVKIMMPFFQFILRKQITFQSIYVNNAVEYQTFWEDSIIPPRSDDGEWSRENYKAVLPYIFHYCHSGKADKSDAVAPLDNFENFHSTILSAYKSGDSFSYFTIERILVIVGSSNWALVHPIIERFFSEEYRSSTWFDYSQMSMLYVVYQLVVNSPESNPDALYIFARECEDWTSRCRGVFKARNSHKANPTQLYKRNVMNWYCVVYCRHTGDAIPHKDDVLCVPVFYKLLDEALSTNDKELLYHLIENISELVTDYGYIHTALGLLKYILVKLDTLEKVEAFDEITLERGGIYQEQLITLVGKALGTAKNYFSAEVDRFIKKEIAGLSFPGISKYREEILSYNPSGETLSDLFTHKFGNFLMWSLLNEEDVDKFAFEAMSAAPHATSSFQWFDQVVRILFKHLFKVKL